MSSGSGSGGQSTTQTTQPAWVQPYAKSFLSQTANQVMPNGQLQSMPQGLNYQTAPFSAMQNSALSNIGNLTGTAQGLSNIGAMSNANFAAGNQAGPNPVLGQYFNSMATPLTSQYNLATQPALNAEFQQAGAFNSNGFNQAQGLAQQGLGQSLASLGTGIAVPAYEQGQQLQLQAAQGTPAAVQGLYAPSQNLYQAGSAQQQQQQNVLNTGQQNAAQQANWPFQLLQQLGGALGQASGGGGNTLSLGSPAGGGK
jgi:hypothetical protein